MTSDIQEKMRRERAELGRRYVEIGLRYGVSESWAHRQIHAASRRPDPQATLIVQAAATETGARPDWLDHRRRGRRGAAEVAARDVSVCAMVTLGWTAERIARALRTEQWRARHWIARGKASASAMSRGRRIAERLPHQGEGRVT